MGPMTGRAAGLCAGYPAPGFANAGFGGGMGRRGGGGGRGRRNRFYATGLTGWQRAGAFAPGVPPAVPMPAGPAPTPEQELAALKAQAEALGNVLEGIQQRIDQIVADTEGK